MRNKIRTIPFRRKREGKTDYKKRLAALKSGLPRLVVRKSNKHMLAQLIEYSDKGDIVVESVSTKNLKKLGWKYNTGNIPSAYLTGYLLGKKLEGKKAILDIGLEIPIKGSKVFAVLKGAVDAGLKIGASKEVFPPEERINGKHIADYASKLGDKKLKKIFSGYLKTKTDPKKIEEEFEKIKKKING
jgi:large subunit ribosomal protein L18